jgi:hypothetical protein
VSAGVKGWVCLGPGVHEAHSGSGSNAIHNANSMDSDDDRLVHRRHRASQNVGVDEIPFAGGPVFMGHSRHLLLSTLLSLRKDPRQLTGL